VVAEKLANDSGVCDAVALWKQEVDAEDEVVVAAIVVAGAVLYFWTEVELLVTSTKTAPTEVVGVLAACADELVTSAPESAPASA
jgi:hypothetical protein